MDNHQQQNQEKTVLDSIKEISKQASSQQEYAGCRTPKRVKYKQPFSKAYPNEAEILKGLGAIIAVTVSVLLLAYIHFRLAANPHEKFIEAYPRYATLYFLLAPVFITFGLLLNSGFKAIKNYLPTVKERQRIRLLPLTEEERKHNNLNSFLAYSSWLVNTFDSNSIVMVNRLAKIIIREDLQSLFMNDFHISSKNSVDINFLYDDECIREGAYHLTESVGVYIEEDKDLGQIFYVYIHFK